MVKTGVKIAPQTAKALFEVGRYVQQQSRNTLDDLSSPVDFGGGTVLITTTTIPKATSGTTPGKGSGKIQGFDGTTFTTADTNVYPIYNITDKIVANGSTVLCVPAYGFFFFVDTACANLS